MEAAHERSCQHVRRGLYTIHNGEICHKTGRMLVSLPSRIKKKVTYGAGTSGGKNSVRHTEAPFMHMSRVFEYLALGHADFPHDVFFHC